jgi:hypothetical protein
MYQASDYFEQNAGRVSAEVSVVDDRFVTEPMTTVKPAEQQVSEEELHRFFEQAISNRMHRINGPLTSQLHTTDERRYAGSVVAPLAESLRQQGGAGIWSSLLSDSWQRGIILASLALLLTMSGFDLMGVLVLHLR